METRQTQLEAEMADRGIDRFKRAYNKARARGDLGDQAAVKTVISSQIEKTSREISRFIDESRSGKPGPNAAWVTLIPDLDVDVLAYLTVRTVINGLCNEHSYSTMQRELGAAVEDEWMISTLAEYDETAIKWVQREIRRRAISSREMVKQYYAKMARERGAPISKWKNSTRIQVGTLLIDRFIEATRLVKLIMTVEGKKTRYRIEPSPQIMSWVLDRNDMLAARQPMWMPMVESPRLWSRNDYGGYHTVDVAPIKGRDHNIPHEVREAIDALNCTPYRVNQEIAKVLEWMVGEDDKRGTLDCTLIEVPTKPEDIETNEEARRSWRKSAREAYDHNTAAASVVLSVRRCLDLADRFKDEPRLYFPCQLDFRGRVYAMPQDLNPQGPDFARALLEFSEGKHVDERGKYWLRVNLANLYGEDKVSLDDRAQWVEDNIGAILWTAADPIDDDFWTTADKPWQFLAAAMDYQGVLKGKPSHVRVGLDGSCNGIQHFAAMLRDPVAARAVNLTESAIPRDIYQDVADVVVARLKTERDPQHRFWADTLLALGVVNRKLTKRSVMVMPYGGTFMSTMKYVDEALKEALGGDNPFGDQWQKASVMLARHVHDGTREVIKSGAEVMSWLQEIAKTVSNQGDHLTWTTPIGFEVQQRYYKMNRKMVKTYLHGKAAIQTVDYVPTDKVDPKDSRNGISPNFVHSLDASAMMMTINAARDEGMGFFHCIHDDFGVHAADTERFGEILREQFVRMYEENDVLWQLWDNVQVDCWERLPNPPEKLGFDLTEVLRSRYFFS